MRICLVKTSSLGDILHAFPVLAYLRQRFPDAEIDWMVERPYAELVRAHPDLTSALVVDTKNLRKQFLTRSGWSAFLETRKQLRQKPYDLLFDLQGNLKSGLLTSQVRCPIKVGPGWKSAAEWIHPFFTHRHIALQKGIDVRSSLLKLVQEYFEDSTDFVSAQVALRLSEQEQEEVASLMHSLGSATYRIFVAPGSIWKNKQLTCEQLLSVLQRLQQQMQVQFLFSWGSSEERQQADFLAQALSRKKEGDSSDAHVLAKRYSLPQLAAIIQNVDLLLGMDSLPLHLAAATSKTPTFAFFGPSSSMVYNPVGSNHGAFQGGCPYGVEVVSRCPKLRRCPTGACLRSSNEDLLADSLLQHIHRVRKIAG